MRLTTLLLALLTASISIAQTPKVTLLATYHMGNPGMDAANMKSDDVKTPKRQQEIQDVVDLLKAFNPTKIAVESSYGSTRTADAYKRFHEHGNYDSLKRNETDQIGFRLAHELGHEVIYPIDFRMDIFPESMQKYLLEHPDQKQEMDDLIRTIQDSLNLWNETILKPGTVGEFLTFFNSTELIEGNWDIYLDFMRFMYDETNSPAATSLSLWYQRNAMIFQNLIRITDFDNPEERILIIYGQGHAKPIIDLCEDSNYYTYIPVNSFIDK